MNRRNFIQQFSTMVAAIAAKPSSALTGPSPAPLIQSYFDSANPLPEQMLAWRLRHAGVEEFIMASHEFPLRVEDYAELLNEEGLSSFNTAISLFRETVGNCDHGARSWIRDELQEAFQQVDKETWDAFVDRPTFFDYMNADGGLGSDWYDVAPDLKKNLTSRSFWKNLYDEFAQGTSPQIEQGLRAMDEMRRARFAQDADHAVKALKAYVPQTSEREEKKRLQTELERMADFDRPVLFSAITPKVPRHGYQGYNVNVARRVLDARTGHYESPSAWQARTQDYARELRDKYDMGDDKPELKIDNRQCARGRLIVSTLPGTQSDEFLAREMRALNGKAR